MTKLIILRSRSSAAFQISLYVSSIFSEKSLQFLIEDTVSLIDVRHRLVLVESASPGKGGTFLLLVLNIRGQSFQGLLRRLRLLSWVLQVIFVFSLILDQRGAAFLVGVVNSVVIKDVPPEGFLLLLRLVRRLEHHSIQVRPILVNLLKFQLLLLLLQLLKISPLSLILIVLGISVGLLLV